MNFIRYSKIYFVFSGILAIISVLSLIVFGLKFGIDFTGGSILEVEFSANGGSAPGGEVRPENQVIQGKLKDLNLGEIIVQPIGENNVVLRLEDIDETVHQQILSKLGEISGIEEKRFESMGSVVGKELREKTFTLIIISTSALLVYIMISFRRVYRQVRSWQYGAVSIITLTFDILITVGVFSFLGKFYNVQFTIPIITALLTILGYAINDKIIIFDRIRENLLRGREFKTFNDLVNRSLNETILRSLSTGTCTLLVLFAIFFLGGETLRYFALTLIVGILAGTYSSLFLASPLLASWVGRKGSF